MKFDFKAIMLGGLAALALTVTPAIFSLDSSAALAQRGIGGLVDLTNEQEDQLRAIRRDALRQVEAVLSAEQKQQFITQVEQGSSVRQAARNINLTTDQVNKIESILNSSMEAAINVLTPEQQAQLEEALTR